ncbi:hypothetical protein HRI_000305900 [Hibiscus trionum]|uniref:Ninja-family protein n=1 Tax=Hibiscus trionum TaxID=183268 RepID=A0A9W7LJE7_HIBTR|nr:hypothetical protein HRI_000305900 [Hibiscus trionum]
MENNCGITGLKEDEIELELGLSIGGIFGKVKKLKPVKNVSKPNEIPVADRREIVDFGPQMQRKIQALRRHEAKKKREEKQQKRSRCHQNGEFRSEDNDGDDVTEERECKKNKVEEFSGGVNFYLNAELNHPSAYPVFPVRVRYPYPHLQFVPVANGFPYSCVNSMPSWGCDARNGQVAVQPVAMNGGLQTGHVHHPNGYDSEQNNSKGEKNKKTGSNGSSTDSSSVINCSTPSNQMDSAQSNDKCSNGGIEKAAPPSMHVAESTSLNPRKAPGKPVLSNEMGKPPKPRAPPIHDVLGDMPCVSTTGNGADGKTINGFLYRYTKSEVSIICVCHGNSFTPAEFVQHAGGNDVSHPLRHITVIPSQM